MQELRPPRFHPSEQQQQQQHEQKGEEELEISKEGKLEEYTAVYFYYDELASPFWTSMCRNGA